jgi:hypothetical protein
MITMAKKKPTMKKLPAVRLAVKELGVDAPVNQVRKLAKEKYNIDLTEATAQNYVSKAKREMRNGKGTPVPVKLPTTAPAPSPARVMPKTTGNGVAIEEVVEAVSTIKGLVGALGKDNLLKLVEAL